jgi:DNA polymerase III sliding clamp (beta) subunit (PCNA family)
MQVQELLDALALGAAVVGDKSSAPALGGVLFVPAVGGLPGRLVVSDGFAWLEVSAGACPEGVTAPVLLSHGKLLSICRAVKDRKAEVEIVSDVLGAAVVVRPEGQRPATWRLPHLDANCFPASPAIPADAAPEGAATIPAGQLAAAFRLVVSAATDPRGVVMEARGGVGWVMGTDACRMVVVECEAGRGDSLSVFFPAAAADVLRKALSGLPTDVPVSVRTFSRGVEFTAGRLRYVFRVLAKDPPPWRTVMARGDRDVSTVVVAVDELLRATRAAAACTEATAQRITVKVELNRVVVSSVSSAGEAAVECELLEGDAWTGRFALDPETLTDFLSAVDRVACTSVDVEITRAGDPVLFRCGDASALIAVLGD